MSKIVKIIEDSRNEGLNDNAVLDKITRILPERKKAFKEAVKRGATPTQILDKIVQDNKKTTGALNLVKIIEDSRRKKLSDKEALDKVIEILPEKKNSLAEALKRGATPTQILDKIILDNEVLFKKKREIKKEKENKKEVESESRKEKTSDRPLNVEKKRGFELKKLLAFIKRSKFFNDFFSVTRNFLIGVDISDHSIEIMLLNTDGLVTSYGRFILEDGIIYNGEILNQKKLSESLKEALRKTKPLPLEIPEHARKKKIQLKKKNHKAIIALPESKTYVQLFEFSEKGNVYDKIEEEIKNTIPIPYDELYWDFKEIHSKKRDVLKILCVAAQRDIVDDYIYFFKSANVDPVVFDVEGASLGRAILPIKKIKEKEKKRKFKDVMADGKSRMIVDLGAKTTTISIFNEEAVLALSVPIPYAGNYFTKKIADKFNISEDDAEVIKKEDGFDKEGRVYENILKKEGERIVEEIKSAQDFYKRKFEEDIKEILLAGGTSLLPGIVEFLNERIEDIEVKVGDPLKRVTDLGMLKNKEAVLYSNVTGLASRALMSDPIRDGYNLLPEEIKNQERRLQVEKHRSVFLVAIFIAVAGIMFLGLAAYYLIYLPVPAPIQPLKQRVLLHIDERSGIEMIDVAVVKDELDEPAYVRKGPGKTQEVIGEAVPGESYRATTQLAGWVRIVFEDTEGWIHGEDLQKIESILLEENEEEETIEEEETTESIE
jgi:type IV pilus assembly protein PilM